MSKQKTKSSKSGTSHPNASKKQTAKKKPTRPTLHPRVLISGYYGFDNLGDELILKVLVDELKARDVKITVLSKNPAKTRQEYGVDAISRTNPLDIIDALAQSHLFISGGGGLFQDATGPMSTLYYGGLIHLAHFFEVPVCFWAQGVGPLNRPFSRKMTASALEKCDAIVVRDEASADLIHALINFRPDVTADPVWLLKCPALPSKNGIDTPEKQSNKSPTVSSTEANPTPFRIGLSLRPWADLTEARMRQLAISIHGYAQSLQRPVELRLLPFQKIEDTHLLETFAEQFAQLGETPVVLCDPAMAVQEVGQCDVVLGMRFHSLILALLQDVPIFGLVYDPKVASLIDMFHVQGCAIQDLETLTANTLQAHFSQYPKIHLKAFQRQARRNVDLLNEMLSIPEKELAL